ncbi:MAG: PilZ domain-containing protein, partial [Syntrophobacteria bacterium]
MKECRRFARKNMDGEVKIFTNGGIHLGGLRDISEGGLAVTTATPYEVGYEMFVSIELPEAVET